MAKQVNFFDGAQSSTVPTVGNTEATSLAQYANDAAYEAANAGSPIEGNIYSNTTDNSIHYYDGTSWISYPNDTSVTTFQNKTIDATAATGNNTITMDSDDVSYDNGASGLTATDVKAAIDEVDAKADANTSASGANTSDIADIRTTTGTSDGDTDMGTFTGSTITDNVSTKTALQELESAVEGVGGGLTFQGTWNASTNSPALSDGTGTQGHFYIVSVAGSTSLDGITDWEVNDWAVFDGTVWRKIDNSEIVTSVNGETGNVVLELNDINDVDTTGVAARYELRRNAGDTAYEMYYPQDTAANSQSGTAVELTQPGTAIVTATNAALVSVGTIVAGYAGQRVTLVNKTGTSMDVVHDTGATSANRIYTGTGADITMEDDSSIDLFYDSTSLRWQVVGSSGGGGASFPLLAPNGSAGAPSYSFSGDTDAGMSYSGSSLALAHDGAFRLELNGSTFRPTSGMAGVMNLGATNRRFSNIYSNDFSLMNASVQTVGTASEGTTPSGITNAYLQRAGSLADLGLSTFNQTAASTDSKSIYIESGNATGTTADSGSIELRVGTATGTQGKIELDAPIIRAQNLQTFSGGFGAGERSIAYVDAAGRVQMGQSGVDFRINGPVTPAADGTLNNGSTALRWGNVSTDQLEGMGGATWASQTTPSGIGSVSGIESAKVVDVGMWTGENADADAVKTQDVFIETGNKTAGTGDSGFINVQTGTSSGGTRGAIKLKDGTEGTVGHVWTQSISDGSGGWAAIPSAGSTKNIGTYSSTATMSASDDIAVLSGASFTLTLMNAAGNTGKVIEILHDGTSLSQVYTVDGASSQTIRGSLTYVMHTKGQRVRMVSDGTNWIVLDSYTETQWASAGTMTISATTTGPTKGSVQSHDDIKWRRVGDSAHIRMTFRQTNGSGSAAGSGDYLYDVTAIGSIDTAKVDVYATVEGWNSSFQNSFSVGSASMGDGGTQAVANVVPYDASYVRIFGLTVAQAGVVGSAGYPLSGANVFYALDFIVPIENWEE